MTEPVTEPTWGDVRDALQRIEHTLDGYSQLLDEALIVMGRTSTAKPPARADRAGGVTW